MKIIAEKAILLLLDKINAAVGSKLADVEEILLDSVTSDSDMMQEILRHIAKGRGKRLRPALMLLCGSLRPANDENLHKAAVAAELIHTASLVHDDIIDGALWRRNQPSVNAGYGNRPAVLVGDFLFARAFELIALCEHVQLFRSFSRVVSVMCEGEMDQAQHLYNLERSRDDYLQNIYRKTAALMETCCGAGARLSGLEAEAVECLEQYGRNLGMAFQIVDDLLDIAGDPVAIGKPIYNDIKEGIVTLPYIFLMEDYLEKDKLKEMIERKDFSSLTTDYFMKYPVKQNGPLIRTLDEADVYAQQTMQCLYNVSLENGSLEADVLQTLGHLAEYVVSNCRDSLLNL